MHVVRSESVSEECGSYVITFTSRAARSLLEVNAPSFPPKLEKTTETPISTTLTCGNDRALPSIIQLIGQIALVHLITQHYHLSLSLRA